MLARLARYAVFLVAAVVLFAIGGRRASGGDRHAPDAAGQAGAARDAEQTIRALIERYTQALLNRDVTALDRIWADDLTFINLRGELLNKQNRLENLKSGATAFTSIQVSDENIRTYGQAAVATFRVSLEARYSGQEGSGDFRATTVWARPRGTWQMVAVQMTRIAQ